MVPIATINELWMPLGTEFVIFVVTLLFAFAISGASGKPAGKKLKGQPCPKAAKRADQVAHEAPPVQADACGTHGRLAKRLAVTSTSSNGKPGRKAARASQIMDTVVEGAKDQPATRFALGVVEKYAEFKVLLEEEGLRVSEVERTSQCSALDFYAALVLCVTRIGKYYLVEGLIDDMIRHGVSRPLNFYESAMKQLAGQKQYHLALCIYDRLVADRLQPSIVTCSCLINFAAEVGEFNLAIDFFNQLASRTTPSIRAYMTVLRVYGKLQDWTSSVSTFREMQRQGVAIDSFVLNVVLATGVATDEMSGVEALVGEVSESRPSLLDTVSYNTLVKGYAQRNDFERVCEVGQRMRARGLSPNAITFNSMMDAAVRSQKSAKVWDLLREMRSSGLRPDKYTCSILVKSLSQQPTPACVQGTVDVLIEVDAAFDNTLRSTLYHAVFEAAAQTGHSALLTQVLARMRHFKVMPTGAMVRRLNDCALSGNSPSNSELHNAHPGHVE